MDDGANRSAAVHRRTAFQPALRCQLTSDSTAHPSGTSWPVTASITVGLSDWVDPYVACEAGSPSNQWPSGDHSNDDPSETGAEPASISLPVVTVTIPMGWIVHPPEAS